MLFEWADHMAQFGDGRWVGTGNLYRTDGKKNGAPAGAPEWMWNDEPGRLRTVHATSNLLSRPANIVLESRGLMGNWGASGCTVTGGHFTAPHIMGQATKFMNRRVATDLTADYDGASVMTHERKTKAKRRLDDKQVVASGIGHYSHYPLAFGFEDARFANCVRAGSTLRWSFPRVQEGPTPRQPLPSRLSLRPTSPSLRSNPSCLGTADVSSLIRSHRNGPPPLLVLLRESA